MKNILAIVVALLLIPITVVANEETCARFVISSGVVVTGTGAPGGDPTVSLLLDQRTGRTWMFGQTDGAVQWIPIIYSSTVPKKPTVPPLLK